LFSIKCRVDKKEVVSSRLKLNPVEDLALLILLARASAHIETISGPFPIIALCHGGRFSVNNSLLYFFVFCPHA
jgi:hypothetical protein